MTKKFFGCGIKTVRHTWTLRQNNFVKKTSHRLKPARTLLRAMILSPNDNNIRNRLARMQMGDGRDASCLRRKAEPSAASAATKGPRGGEPSDASHVKRNGLAA
jgi:hypothetical protein